MLKKNFLVFISVFSLFFQFAHAEERIDNHRVRVMSDSDTFLPHPLRPINEIFIQFKNIRFPSPSKITFYNGKPYTDEDLEDDSKIRNEALLDSCIIKNANKLKVTRYVSEKHWILQGTLSALLYTDFASDNDDELFDYHENREGILFRMKNSPNQTFKDVRILMLANDINPQTYAAMHIECHKIIHSSADQNSTSISDIKRHFGAEKVQVYEVLY